MNKKIIIYASVIFAFVVIVVVLMYLLVRKPTPNNSGPPANQGSGSATGSQLPSYVLSADEEKQVTEFVNNFTSLYNSYSYQNFSNPSSLGNFETLRMQNETIQRNQKLQAELPPGFSIQADADSATFSYDYPSAQNLFATMSAHVTERQGNAVTKTYDVSARLELIRTADQRWLVNEINITPK